MKKPQKNIPLKLLSVLGGFLPVIKGDNQLNILIYHRVIEQFDDLMPFETTKREFDWQMEMINNYFNILPLSVAINLLKRGTLPRNAICITFDDGYKDNYTNALPILKKYNLVSTFFIASGFLNGGLMWNDKIRELIRGLQENAINLEKFNLGKYTWQTNKEKYIAIEHIVMQFKYMQFNERLEKIDELVKQFNGVLPTDEMMNDEEVQALSLAGMEIGGHTVNHPILAKLNSDEAEKEIRENKIYLEKLLNKKISVFAFPNGKPGEDFTLESIELIKKAGYIGSVSTSIGVSNAYSDIYQLPRFTPWDKNEYKFMMRLILNKFSKPQFI